MLKLEHRKKLWKNKVIDPLTSFLASAGFVPLKSKVKLLRPTPSPLSNSDSRNDLTLPSTFVSGLNDCLAVKFFFLDNFENNKIKEIKSISFCSTHLFL